MNQKILLVEGESDKDFFQELCYHIGLNIEIKVSTPRDQGSRRDGKLSAINLLPNLMKQLADGNITHLAIVVDADYASENGLGYQRTFEHITEKIIPFGYNSTPNQTLYGLTFTHSDGLRDFGLWIMPDNTSEGMLEDWIKKSIISTDQELFYYASSIVKTISTPKFKPIHCSKAEVATWLAWQKSPGKGNYALISDSLLDMQSPSIKQLIEWLKHIYT